jgi:hypothetical protein
MHGHPGRTVRNLNDLGVEIKRRTYAAAAQAMLEKIKQRTA